MNRSAFWKEDVHAAYRRAPVLPEHRPLLWVAFVAEGQVWAAGHNSMPFGYTSACFGWDRIGAMIASIARSALRLPVQRFVDDFYGVEMIHIYSMD